MLQTRIELSGTSLIERVQSMTYAGREPFHETSIKLLTQVSSALLGSQRARRQPQYMALGYWLRPSALARLRQATEGRTGGDFLVPRGVALHLPPTNVDTIFVYSWAISVMAGNCNITRMPTSLSDDTRWLVDLIESVVLQEGESNRHLFVNIPHTGAEISAVSSLCDLRLVWGGDAKVAAVSKVPLRPDGLSIGFSDRVSFAAIQAAAYAKATQDERNELAARFSNDIFWFDQMGCGSPRVVFWVGDPEGNDEDLYRRIQEQAQKKGIDTTVATSIAKFHRTNDLLAEGLSKNARHYSNALYVLETDTPQQVSERGTGGGFLLQTIVNDIVDIALSVNRKVQTITHFGFSRAQLDKLAVSISSRGGYRVVPIGNALQFNDVWDGLPLLEMMTRRIVVTE